MADHTHPRLKVNGGAFSVSWITSYTSLLATADGTMLTRAGYAGRHRSKAWLYPWEIAERVNSIGPLRAPIASDHFDSFWGRYLLNQKRLYWALDESTAWDLVVPLRRPADQMTLRLPGYRSVSSAELDALLYPHAVAISVRVAMTGPWSLAAMAEQLADVRRSSKWQSEGTEGARPRRLEEIASNVQRKLAAHLTAGVAVPLSAPSRVTVAALTSIEGTVDTGRKDVKARLAGLADLREEGNASKAGFLAKNRLRSHSARVYTSETGHVIWPAEDSPNNLEHMLRSHTELVSHVVVLNSIAAWAKDQIDANLAIPVEVQPLVQRAIRRLQQLHDGDERVTYRSLVAQQRIAPHINDLSAVAAAL